MQAKKPNEVENSENEIFPLGAEGILYVALGEKEIYEETDVRMLLFSLYIELEQTIRFITIIITYFVTLFVHFDLTYLYIRVYVYATNYPQY